MKKEGVFCKDCEIPKPIEAIGVSWREVSTHVAYFVTIQDIPEKIEDVTLAPDVTFNICSGITKESSDTLDPVLLRAAFVAAYRSSSLHNAIATTISDIVRADAFKRTESGSDRAEMARNAVFRSIATDPRVREDICKQLDKIRPSLRIDVSECATDNR